MVSCHTSGIAWDTIYNWNVDEFIDIYHSLQRNEARTYLKQFSCLQMAFGGDKKSLKEFINNASVWLPKEERQGGRKYTDDFLGMLGKSKMALKK